MRSLHTFENITIPYAIVFRLGYGLEKLNLKKIMDEREKLGQKIKG